MRVFTFIVMLAVSTTLFANELIVDYYNTKKSNKLICKITTNSYKIVTQQNSSLHTINGTTFFKMKNENTYINSSACHPVQKENTAIIF